ncbi:vesicle-trafficking protein SEC22c [Gambusia affinis]|uniref:vesicle-trafficking protein SEC22c n=1 Tax=Gambusia affinis TaxID=33528 RepID=UPI001CDD054F|nr:vesicle-trafficking protein SEC22c [Gambusia affinis]
MSLILFAFVVRVRDGLPLSASTDFEHNKELQERKQQLRTISKSLPRFPERGTVKGQKLNIYFVSSEGVSYMSVCHSSLPVAKAFCFVIVLCNLYLLGLRNIWQLLFHISVASLSTSLTLTRRIHHRTDDCGV